jgi:predicted transposase YdaD
MQIYDKLWKGAIEDLVVDFLRFFYQDADNIFDFSKKPEFLDKELEELFPDQKNTTRHVDKLVKVWLKDGSVKWILIHCEVQGYGDKDFELRMFIYFYRIFRRYKLNRYSKRR